jgi:CHAT domain-containing protein
MSPRLQFESDNRPRRRRPLAASVPGIVALGLLLCVLGAPALHAAEPVGGPGEAPDALLAQASAAIAAGSQAHAAELAARAAAAAQAAGRDDLVANALAVEGEARLLAGDRGAAQERLEAALAKAGAAQRPDVAARAANDLGLLHSARGDHAGAIAQFDASIAAAETASDPVQALRATINRARALDESGQGANGRATIRAAQPRLSALPESVTKVALLTSAGRLLGGADRTPRPAAQDIELGVSLLGEADAAAARLGDARGRSYALGYRAEIYAAAGQSDAALTLARQAIHQAQLAGAAESQYRWQWLVGRVLRQQNDLVAATEAYVGAVQTLESVRQDITASERAGAGDGFRRSAGPLYVELVDVLLTRSRTAASQEQQQLLRQARDTMETLKSAELEDYFQDDCVAGLKSKTVGIDTVGARTAAIYPVVLPDRLALLVSLSDGLRLYESPVPADTLNAEVTELRARLEKRSTYQYLPHARKLYDWVMRPLVADLDAAGVTTLVFVPDGSLRTVPLAALNDGAHFVVERYAVATVPGLKLTDPRPLTAGASTALLSGLTESVQGFAALPAVGAELEQIGKIYPGTVLEDKTFTKAGFEQALGEANYAVVHVASHGQFGGSIDDTFLLTHDSRIAMNDLETYIGRTSTREQPVELLTLSACQTAAGNERAALGLAGVAVKAGARSAVAPLWSVNDRASAELVSTFYTNLRGGVESKAAALQAAQLALLGEARYRHPAYWSPFLLIGNWL